MSDPRTSRRHARLPVLDQVREHVHELVSDASSSSDSSRARAKALSVALESTRDPVERREFLVRLGATLGLAGLAACTRAPREQIVPYVTQPPGVTPGKARSYATALTLDGYATGVLVESHEGRPTKVEGNPDHPASLGASSAFDQASVASLYDPCRARAVSRRGALANWDSVVAALLHGPWTEARGRGLHVVLEPTSSPTVAALLDQLRARLPAAEVHFEAPLTRANVWAGARLAFGRVLEPRVDLSDVDVVVALDADLFGSGPAQLRLSRQFADRRRVAAPTDAMSRLYVVEPLMTPTGIVADHRLRVGAQHVVAVAATLLDALAAAGVQVPGIRAPSTLLDRGAPHRGWIEAVARDLAAHRGRSVVVVGDMQPPEVHALAHALNAALGNLGTTVRLAPSPIVEAGGPSHDRSRLVAALGAGEVDTLLVLGANPGYTWPYEAGESTFVRLAKRARQSAYVGLYEDETARACTFLVAQAHPLESWGDARAFDGTVSVVQPLVEPLLGGRMLLDVLALFAGRAGTTSYELVRDRFRGRGAPDDVAWQRALRLGVVQGTALSPVSVEPNGGVIAAALARAADAGAPAAGLELVLRADPRVHDGRFANNAWLLELPTPVEKLTWTNAATLSVETARALGVANGDEVEIRVGPRAVHAPALVATGQAASTVGLTLGWGREGSEELARGRGANAYALRGEHDTWMLGGVTVVKTGARRDLPRTQGSHGLHGRDEQIAQHATLDEYRTSPRFRDREHAEPKLLYAVRPDGSASSRQWGMAIDLSVCTACSACVVACQAENNVPTVGPDGVLMGRAMHWLRIDTYFVGDPADPRIIPQPMLCQHCEMAPCEYVCPVNATVHSSDGLNQMVYNRCVGTRFCSNNCPYKVRRFNWFDYHEDETDLEQLAHNPDVTVRERGVMEKCTFCVQRLREREIRERVEGAKPRPPLQTACQQACPTRAIVFGEISNPASEVTRLHVSDRTYAALDDLGTLPRVRYLTKIVNRNPELG